MANIKYPRENINILVRYRILKTLLLSSCLMGNVLFVRTAVSNMLGAHVPTTLA